MLFSCRVKSLPVSGTLLDSAQSGTSRQVEVRLPAFAINTPVELLPALDRMGSGKIFDDTDLSGIAGKSGDLVVTNVVHQAKIAVDENGAAAAAATAVVGPTGSSSDTRGRPIHRRPGVPVLCP